MPEKEMPQNYRPLVCFLILLFNFLLKIPIFYFGQPVVEGSEKRVIDSEQTDIFLNLP